ncbi:MAG: type II toxin-antitoxin system HipA family toxin [Muricoprocola sp.]
MKEINNLTVKYHDRTVGILAETKDGKGAFQYDKEWLRDGFSISPLSLPLDERVFVPQKQVFEGLFGVFADSLPDGWGRLLVDRKLLSMNISPHEVSAVTRLGIVGSNGMGALEYYPEILTIKQKDNMDFDYLAAECERILQDEKCDNLDMLFQMGGSSGGARPKALISVDNESWIVKFPSSYDRKSIGEEEYRYMKCAEKSGILVPEIRLFPSKYGKGYFGAKRFDRVDHNKTHMITVSGLLETSHRIPNLDYHDLFRLTYILTKDERQLEELFRRMCFNVFAHNRDDHSKNFSFLYDEKSRQWKLTPAYDLTYSNSIGGEHACCVNGEGRNPGLKDILAIGEKAGLSKTKIRIIAEEIQEIVENDLKDILDSYKS